MQMGKLSDVSLKVRLIWLFLIVSLIPTLVVGGMSLRISSDAMIARGVQDSLNSLEFIQYKVNALISKKHTQTLQTAYSRALREFGQHILEGAEVDELLEQEVKHQLLRYFNNYDTHSVILSFLDGRALRYSSSGYASAQWVNAKNNTPVSDAPFAIFDRWCDAAMVGTDRVIPYQRLVLAPDSDSEVALLTVNLKESSFNEIYRDYEASGAEYFILSHEGTIQSCTDGTKFAQNSQEAIGLPVAMLNQDKGQFVLGEKMAVYVYNAQRKLYFLELLPLSKLNGGFGSILSLTISTAILCVAISVVLGYLLSTGFTKPLHKLIERLSGLGAKGTVQSKNELVILSDRYGVLMSKLETAIHQYNLEQKKKREAQIRALECQINPHFLYNTLSTIVWLIENKEHKSAIKITKKLSSFFRISISKGKQYITIEEEAEHVKLYLDVQMARYADKIAVSFDLPDELAHYGVPKLILQPLVENAIVHAMSAGESELQIKIAGRKANGEIFLSVADNGECTEQAQIDSMNEFLRTRTAAAPKNYGIGIANVHDRVRMCFGAPYGLQYSRTDGQTVAVIRLKGVGLRPEEFDPADNAGSEGGLHV